MAGFMIAAELAQRRFVELKKNLAQCLGFRMPSGETLSVDLTQRADERVPVLMADFAVVIAVAIVETCFAHGALHYSCSLRASSRLDQMAILRRNRDIKVGAYRTTRRPWPAPGAKQGAFGQGRCSARIIAICAIIVIASNEGRSLVASNVDVGYWHI